MSALPFMRAIAPVITCWTGFVPARMSCTRSKRPNSAISPASAFCTAVPYRPGYAVPGTARRDRDRTRFFKRRAECRPAPLHETGLKRTLSRGRLIRPRILTPGPFHLVFTTWGTICWLPDVKKWAEIIASVLTPGGELYFADAHPAFNVLEEDAGRLVATFDFKHPSDRPLQFVGETTYTGDPTIMTHQSTREWIHSLSAVLGGLMDAGLTITMFHEHEILPWRGLPSLVPASDRMWRLPDGLPVFPVLFSQGEKRIVRHEPARRGDSRVDPLGLLRIFMPGKRSA